MFLATFLFKFEKFVGKRDNPSTNIEHRVWLTNTSPGKAFKKALPEIINRII